MIKHIKKDVTTVERGIIAHGCNCQGVMGAGIAKAIKDKWPEVYQTYSKLPTGKTMLGTAHLVSVSDTRDDHLFVANCFTQQFYGNNGKFADPDAIKTSLKRVYEFGDYYDLDIYMPQIGCGLGGLKWEKDVEPIIKELDSQWERINTYVCTL